MEEIIIRTENATSKIYVGEKLSNLPQYIKGKPKVIIVTDFNILKHYGDILSQYPIIEIGSGENIKTLSTIDYIMNKLVEFEADRTSFIVGVGGGIVCDIVGFAASIYMRGIKFGFVSSTLLSQVDASVGGKNGVNYKGYKNMIGVFNQPEFVICDTSLLKTLDKREIINGFAEVIKHGLIRNKFLFEFLEQNHEKALNIDEQTLNYCISESIKIKAKVVENDEREKGERRILNFGHTFGHAIEKITGISHGYAVAIGMKMASYISMQLSLITGNEYQRIIQLIENFQLPTSFPLNADILYDAMKKDKKRKQDEINLVLLESIGNAIIKPLPYEQLKKFLYDLC